MRQFTRQQHSYRALVMAGLLSNTPAIQGIHLLNSHHDGMSQIVAAGLHSKFIRASAPVFRIVVMAIDLEGDFALCSRIRGSRLRPGFVSIVDL